MDTSARLNRSYGARGWAPQDFYFSDPDGNVVEARYYDSRPAVSVIMADRCHASVASANPRRPRTQFAVLWVPSGTAPRWYRGSLNFSSCVYRGKDLAGTADA